MDANISFHLIKDACTTLGATQALAIQMEDVFINARKWKWEVQTLGMPSSSNPTDLVLQKLMNDVAMMKRQQNKTHGSFQTPYQDTHRQSPPQNPSKNPTRLQIEERPKQTMCSFHMTTDHDEQDCLEWLNYVQLARNAIVVEQASRKSKVENENLGTYFL